MAVGVASRGPLPGGPRADLSITKTVEIERLESVLYLDRPVQVSPEGATMVFKLSGDGKGATRVPARLGRAAVSGIEVRSGPAKGDEIILSGMSQWEVAGRVKLK